VVRYSAICISAVLIVLVAGLTPVYGQASATILGTITDPSGAVVSNTKVTAKSIDTGQERVSNSSSGGLYHFEGLPPGTYRVTAQAAGFATSQVERVLLEVGDQRDINFALQIAKQAGEVVVTAEAPLIESTRTDISSVISSAQVENLPTTTSFNGVGGVSNDYQGLATLAPGVKYDFSGNSSDLIGPGSVNNRGVMVNIDGGNISDQIGSARDALGASIDEVQEFQVLTNSYNAEYGQAGGVILNVITKSGTNEFHGDGHIYFRGRNLEASNFFYNLTDEAKYRRAPFYKREGGFTFGAPIKKDKTFFFGSYEITHQGAPATLSPPTGIVTISQPTDELLYSVRLDHQISSNNRIFARYNAQRDLQDNLIVQVPNFASPGSLVSSVVHDDTLNITDTWTSGTIVNEGRFFIHRYLSGTPDKSSLPAELGPNFYLGAAFCCPQGALQHRYQYMDNLSIVKGAHTFKAGFNISYFPYQSLFQQYHFGEYTGFGAYPNIGTPTALTVALGPGAVKAADKILGFYIQDTWKIRPNLTLNYGLRYDVELGAFDGGTVAKSGGGCYQGNGIVPACSSDYNNFQPRIGFAWSPKPAGGFLGWIFGTNGQSVVRASFAEVTELAYLNIVLDSLNFDGVNLLTGTITDPSVLKYFPNLPPTSVLQPFLPQGFYGRVRPIAPNLKNPEVRNAAFSISRQLGRDFALEVGFLGVYGFGLFGESDVNYPAVIQDPAHPGYYYFGNRPNPAFLAIRTNENSRTSSYNSGYVRLDKRFSSHYRFQGSYTYSKQLATSEDFYGTSEPGNPFDIRADRGPTQNDLRHQFSGSVIYDSGKLVQNSVAKHLVNDLTISVISQAQSGRPYPISTGDAPFGSSFFPGIGAETQQRPSIDATGNIVTTNIGSTSGTNLLISQAGHAACPACPQTTFLAPVGANSSGPIDSLTGDPVDFQFLNGNLSRNAAKGSPYVRFDLSLIKAIKIREKYKIELKADAFNVLNHTNFLLYNNLDTTNNLPISTNPNCTSCLNAVTGFLVGSGGQILNIHMLQHGRVSPNLQSPIFGGIGDPATADIPRQIQLALRFRF
jgi:hypothetical protein